VVRPVATFDRFRHVIVTPLAYVRDMPRFATSCAFVGATPTLVRVETTLSGGRGQFIIVGLPDVSVRESRERVRSAIKASGYRFPPGRVVVNLSPADLPKVGSAYDLPIALSIIEATEQMGLAFEGFVVSGELSLDGEVKASRGALAAAAWASEEGTLALISSSDELPSVFADHAGGVETLRHAVDTLRGLADPDVLRSATSAVTSHPDLAIVRGQPVARRALEVAAAGGHHLLMVGPPGAGKSLLAGCLPGILPELSDEAQREVGLVSAATGSTGAVDTSTPFRAPHHSITTAALVGGGSGLPTPGEISRAHRGVLFLDELGEFPPSVLDSLRQPMEQGSVLVSRQAGSVRFPSDIQVVAASNPCPCGYLGDRLKGCECSESRRDRYRARLSGPLLDRFDLRLAVHGLRPLDMVGAPGEPSEAVRGRVMRARQIQTARGILNRSLSAEQLAAHEDARALVALVTSEPQAEHLTARGLHRVRRVARTIADLDGSDLTTDVHLKEAFSYRGDLP
jgi:magnesium chelatase family protein